MGVGMGWGYGGDGMGCGGGAWRAAVAAYPCLPSAPQWGPPPGTLLKGGSPAPRSCGVASWLSGRARGGSGRLRGSVAVPGPIGVPAPSPTAAIPSSGSGSARAAGINQPGGAASAEPMRSGCCHGDAGRC